MIQNSKLIGRTVFAVAVERSRQNHLRWATDAGVLYWTTEGDCCSESWFADIIGHEYLCGRVVSVEEIELPNYDVKDGRCRQEEDEAYGFRVTTERGTCDIIFRNSSNGYYGGWADETDEEPLQYISRLIQKPYEWDDISGDWHAPNAEEV